MIPATSQHLAEAGMRLDAQHWSSSKLGTFAHAKRTTCLETHAQEAAAKGGCGHVCVKFKVPCGSRRLQACMQDVINVLSCASSLTRPQHIAYAQHNDLHVAMTEAQHPRQSLMITVLACHSRVVTSCWREVYRMCRDIVDVDSASSTGLRTIGGASKHKKPGTLMPYRAPRALFTERLGDKEGRPDCGSYSQHHGTFGCPKHVSRLTTRPDKYKAWHESLGASPSGRQAAARSRRVLAAGAHMGPELRRRHLREC